MELPNPTRVRFSSSSSSNTHKPPVDRVQHLSHERVLFSASPFDNLQHPAYGADPAPFAFDGCPVPSPERVADLYDLPDPKADTSAVCPLLHWTLVT